MFFFRPTYPNFLPLKQETGLLLFFFFWPKGPVPLQRGDNHKNGVGLFKDLLLMNHWARKGHIYMKAFWHNVDSNFFKSRSPRVGRGHINRKTIITCVYVEKQIFSRTSRPISIKHGTNHPWVNLYIKIKVIRHHQKIIAPLLC
jgi:hypothetical protein